MNNLLIYLNHIRIFLILEFIHTVISKSLNLNYLFILGIPLFFLSTKVFNNLLANIPIF